MPLMKYFGFVGSALVLLLLVISWLLPEPANEPVHGGIERPIITIRSIETLPEKVVFDTSLPYVAPPPSVTPVAVQLPQSAFTFEQVTPGMLPTLSTVPQVAPKMPVIVKRDPAIKVTTHRAPPRAHTAAAKSYTVRETEQNVRPLIRTTFLEDIAGRLGKMLKVN